MGTVRRKIGRILFSVGMKINIMLVCIFFIIATFVLYSQRQQVFYHRTYTSRMEMANTIVELKKKLKDSQTDFSAYISTGNRVELNKFNDDCREAKRLLDQFSGYTTSTETTFLLQSIETSFANYFSECCQASFNFNSSNNDYYQSMHSAQTIQSFLLQYCDELLEMVIKDSAAQNSRLAEKIQAGNTFSIIFLLLYLSIVLLFILYVTSNVTRPMGNLVEEAKKISGGDFSGKVKEIKKRNSMALLIGTFNKMIRDIRQMMDRLQLQMETEKKLREQERITAEYEKLLNESRFLALQSQTNPHFLFNTLNSISRMITLRKDEQSLQMIDSLSQLLRYSLSDASQPVPLLLELNATEQYMEIQKNRFGNRLSYRIVVNEQLARLVYLPKFTMQPLVENAIIHGLEPREGGGKIRISASASDSIARICIFDTGVGIPEPLLSTLKTESDLPKGEERHIGLANTRARLQIFTGFADALTISSRQGKGTLLVLTIPIGRESDV